MGDYCDRCEEGYVGDATKGDCTPIVDDGSLSNPFCNCSSAGSLSMGDDLE